MSMSFYLRFFRSADDPNLKTKLIAAYACQNAGVALPEELATFFKPVIDYYGEMPEDEQDSIDIMLEIESDYKDNREQYGWGEDHMEGFEIPLASLPKDVAVVRFIISY